MPGIKRNWRPANTGTASTHLTDRVQELRSALRLLDPELVAARSGASYHEAGSGRGELHILLWGSACILSLPELKAHTNTNDELPVFQQALLFYYLLTSDGTPLTGNWVSFADLPNGRMYNAAFQGYSGNEISKTFVFDLDAFSQACTVAGGIRTEGGDAAYVFQALPRVPVLVNYWLGDDDFPSSCKILFDGSASHYLPIDACAILGSTLTRKLVSFHK